MKKKTIISLLAGAALCFSMPSCMDLDETVYDKLPADSFGQTQVELNALVGNVHNTMKRYASNYMHLSECIAYQLPKKTAVLSSIERG